MIELRGELEHLVGAGVLELKFFRIVVDGFLIGNLAGALNRDRNVGWRGAWKRFGINDAGGIT